MATGGEAAARAAQQRALRSTRLGDANVAQQAAPPSLSHDPDPFMMNYDLRNSNVCLFWSLRWPKRLTGV